MREHRLYRIWKAMRTRCNNPNFHAYKYYGGKGVKICDEWDSYETFYNWAIQNGYDHDLTIDRINNNDGYSPSNCRWISHAEQQNNRSNRVTQIINGEEMTLKQIAERYGLNKHTVTTRYDSGWRGIELIRPSRESTVVEVNGEKLTLLQLSRKYEIPWSTVRDRYRKGVRGVELTEKRLSK